MGVQKKQPDEIVEPVQEQVPVIEAPAEPTPDPVPEPEPKKAGRPKKEKKPRTPAQLANDEKKATGDTLPGGHPLHIVMKLCRDSPFFLLILTIPEKQVRTEPLDSVCHGEPCCAAAELTRQQLVFIVNVGIPMVESIEVVVTYLVFLYFEQRW